MARRHNFLTRNRPGIPPRLQRLALPPPHPHKRSGGGGASHSPQRSKKRSAPFLEKSRREARQALAPLQKKRREESPRVAPARSHAVLTDELYIEALERERLRKGSASTRRNEPVLVLRDPRLQRVAGRVWGTSPPPASGRMIAGTVLKRTEESVGYSFS